MARETGTTRDGGETDAETESDAAEVEETDPLAWETLYGETAYMCPGFDVQCEQVRLPDGTETDFDFLSESESVVIVPFLDQDRSEVVLIEEWRQAVKRVNRGFPAGGVEPADGADLEATAHRELTEETGYEAESVEHLTTVEPTNGNADTVHHYFAAYGCTPTGEQDLDFNESIRVTTADFDELREQVREDEVRDGRTAMGVLYYDAFGE